jgi:putative aminopeptidase FrvX
MNVKKTLKLAQELLLARGPCGQEDEVREIVMRELSKHCDKAWVDRAGNATGIIKGKESHTQANRKAPVIQAMAHMDELSLIVKKVEPDGRLRVRPLGGLLPWVFGLGAVEIMGDHAILPGILSVGALHTTHESPASWRSKVIGEAKTLEWPQVHVFTRLSATELTKAGVHAGTRVVFGQAERQMTKIQDCLACRFVDNRIPLAAMLCAAEIIATGKQRPVADIYLVGTCGEEIANGGASFSAGKLDVDISLALDVGPTAAEYGTELSADPIVLYGDKRALYSKKVADSLRKTATKLNIKTQTAVFENYGSDATQALSLGHVPMNGGLCIPTDNTHAYEVFVEKGLENMTRLLVAWLLNPGI